MLAICQLFLFKKLFYAQNNIVGYFNYHSKIKKLIRNGELISFEIVDSYKNIAPAMILYFKNHSPIPVREEHFDEYLQLMNF